jgi:hypothetical protein
VYERRLSGEGASQIQPGFIPCDDVRNRVKQSGIEAVLDSPSLGMLIESRWDLDHQRRLSSSLSWDRSLTFVCDQSSPIHAGLDAEGRLRTSQVRTWKAGRSLVPRASASRSERRAGVRATLKPGMILRLSTATKTTARDVGWPKPAPRVSFDVVPGKTSCKPGSIGCPLSVRLPAIAPGRLRTGLSFGLSCLRSWPSESRKDSVQP